MSFRDLSLGTIDQHKVKVRVRFFKRPTICYCFHRLLSSIVSQPFEFSIPSLPCPFLPTTRLAPTKMSTTQSSLAKKPTCSLHYVPAREPSRSSTLCLILRASPMSPLSVLQLIHRLFGSFSQMFERDCEKAYDKGNELIPFFQVTSMSRIVNPQKTFLNNVLPKLVYLNQPPPSIVALCLVRASDDGLASRVHAPRVAPAGADARRRLPARPLPSQPLQRLPHSHRPSFLQPSLQPRLQPRGG